MSRSRSSGCGAARVGSGMSTAIVSPGRTTRLADTGFPAIVTCPVFDEPLDLGTRMAGEHARQKPIDADPGLVCRDRELVARHVRQAARLAAFARRRATVRRDR